MTAQPPIVTLTMNPALDLTVEVEQMVPGMKLRTGPPRIEPGGGGVNAARAIAHLGGRARALYAAGGEVGRRLGQLLEIAGIDTRVIELSEETREGVTAVERSSGQQFRLVMPGPTLATAEWEAGLEAVAEEAGPEGFVIGSGSLPPGVPHDFYARLVRVAREAGSRTVLDGPGDALRPALAEQPFLIKPNWREFDELVGEPVAGEERAAAAERIVGSGGAEVVVVTLGAEGARLTTADGHVHMHPPHVAPVSAVGAGDSFTGAMVLAISRGAALVEACRYGVGAATATQIAPGTELCSAQDTERFAAQVTVEDPLPQP